MGTNMKSLRVRSVPLIIGYGNWIVVVIMISTMYINIAINPKVTPRGMYAVGELISFYLKYSFLPALISLALTSMADKGKKVVNFAINILFLILYILINLFIKTVMNGA